MYTVGGRHEGDNKVYTFTTRPVHLMAASYLLLTPVQAQGAIQVDVHGRREEKIPDRAPGNA